MNTQVKRSIAIILTVAMVLATVMQSFAAPLSYAKPAATGTEAVKVTGTWITDAAGNWHFNSQAGAAADGWYYLNTTNNATDYNWFCFDANGAMKTGWVQDKNDPSVWYYTGESKDSSEGGLVRGWITDPQDGKRYYTDPSTGIMCHGWKQINGLWYYFGESQYADRRWAPDANGYWKDGMTGKHSYGSLYVNEHTPDGYYVGSNGAWIQNTGGSSSSRKPDPVPVPTTITIASILPSGFATSSDAGWKNEENSVLYVNNDNQLEAKSSTPSNYLRIDTSTILTADNDKYSCTDDNNVTWTFNMSDDALERVTIASASYSELNGTYSKSECIAAGTMISMPGGKQKAVEELEIGDVVCTFDHETGEMSSAPVCFIWESKNVGNAFTLTFEDDIEVTVIEEHGFYDQEEQKYVFINLQNAQEYIGDHFYNADTGSWLALESCVALNDRVDAYAIITSGHLNHMSNGMLSMCDGSVKMLANIFEYDGQMKFDEAKKKADIEAYGLMPKEKILELEGFIESDYEDYNLQYLNVAIGKGLITWEWMEALSEYCVVNGFVYNEQTNNAPMTETAENAPIAEKPDLEFVPEGFEERKSEELIPPEEAVVEESTEETEPDTPETTD